MDSFLIGKVNCPQSIEHDRCQGGVYPEMWRGLERLLHIEDVLLFQEKRSGTVSV